MTFALDAKAHRFTIKFRTKPSPNVWEHLPVTGSFSRAFRSYPWEEALREVHREAWQRWSLAKEQTAFHLPHRDNCLPQEPGCVPEDMLSSIREHIEQLPSPVKYPRAE